MATNSIQPEATESRDGGHAEGEYLILWGESRRDLHLAIDGLSGMARTLYGPMFDDLPEDAQLLVSGQLQLAETVYSASHNVPTTIEEKIDRPRLRAKPSRSCAARSDVRARPKPPSSPGSTPRCSPSTAFA